MPKQKTDMASPPPWVDLTWRERAACAGADPEQFDALHDIEGVELPARALFAAWENCSWCPVLGACRDWADKLGEPGVLGGQWRVKENPTADRVHAVDLLTPQMRARFLAVSSERQRAEEDADLVPVGQWDADEPMRVVREGVPLEVDEAQWRADNAVGLAL